MSLFSDDKELRHIECRLDAIEDMLRQVLCLEKREAVEHHAVHALNLQAGKPVAIDKPKPPTQGIGVLGSDQGEVGKVSAPPIFTDDMRSIIRLINEPHVRMLLLKEAKCEAPEQVQHQRVLCERIVLGACGGKTVHDLVSGTPAFKLKALVHRLAVFSGGF